VLSVLAELQHELIMVNTNGEPGAGSADADWDYRDATQCDVSRVPMVSKIELYAAIRHDARARMANGPCSVSTGSGSSRCKRLDHGGTVFSIRSPRSVTERP
jgi:hypothetical protein